MRFDYVLTAVLVGAGITVSIQTQILAATVSDAVSTNDLRQIAQEITVLINGEQGSGSGVIIARKGKSYYVLTAAHVVKFNSMYQIVTYDRRQYQASTVLRKLPNVDLAILEFQSEQNYRVATIADYNLPETISFGGGANIYISGWNTSKVSNQPVFSCGATFKGDFASFLRKDPVSDGYELAYTNITEPGLSGSPILDNQGRVIGIHGRVEGEDLKVDELKLGFSLGIPTQIFLQIVERSSIQLPLVIERKLPNNPLTQSWSGSDPCEINTSSLHTPDADGIDWANYANSMLRVGKPVDALSAYNEAIKRNAELYQIWYGRGLTLLLLNRPNEALKTFDRSLQLLGQSRPIDASEIRNLSAARAVLLRYEGMLLSGSKRYQEALAAYDKALSTKPDDYRIWVLRAGVLRELNRDSEAIAAYDKAIEIEPSSLVFLARSNLYSQSGQYRQAIEDLNATIQLSPYDAQSYAIRGALRKKLGDERGASDDYEQVDKLTSQLSGSISVNYGRFLIGQAEFSIGNIKEGTQSISQGLMGIDDGNMGVMVVGVLEEIFSQPDKLANSEDLAETMIAALNKYTNRTGTELDESSIHLMKASIYLQNGDSPKALHEIDQAIKLNRGNEQIHMAYAMRSAFREKRGDEQGAKEDFDKALKATTRLFEVYSTRAAARLRLGNKQGALADLQVAARMTYEQKDMENYQQIMSLIDHIQLLPD